MQTAGNEVAKSPNEHTAWQNMVRVAVYARNNIVLIFTPTSAVYTHNTCTDRHRRPGPNTQGLEQSKIIFLKKNTITIGL